MACALGVAEAEGTSQERLRSADALKNSMFQSAASCAGALSLMMDGSNSSLQARSPCTTAAALCLPAAMPTHLMPLAPGATHTNSCKHAYMMLTAHARVMRSGIIWRLSVDELSRRDALKRCS